MSFDVSELCFAHVKGNREWPAFILEKKAPNYKVQFFGDNTTANVKVSELKKYTLEKSNKEVEKVKDKPKLSPTDLLFLSAHEEIQKWTDLEGNTKMLLFC